MSSLLYRLGRWSATHAWRVVAIWVVLLAVVGAMAGTLGKPLSSRITIPDTQFQRVLDTLGREIPGSSWSLIGSDADECGQEIGCNPDTCYAERARKKARD